MEDNLVSARILAGLCSEQFSVLEFYVTVKVKVKNDTNWYPISSDIHYALGSDSMKEKCLKEEESKASERTRFSQPGNIPPTPPNSSSFSHDFFLR